MSKRAGTFVTLRDVVDEVGRDPVRFMMLYRKELEELDFDFAKVTEQSKDNPVFYVQYAHARAASILRNTAEAFPDLTSESDAVRHADLAPIADAGEHDLIRKLAFFPTVVIWLLLFTANGREAMICHNCALFSLVIAI
jgi:arginyl-tRNA synthetase